MAKKIEQQIKFCKKCNKNTIHIKNGEEIRWIMHLVLAIFTGGIWLIAFFAMLIWKGLTSPIPGTGGGSGWICGECGK